MANQEHFDILMQGLDVWNQWRRDNPALKPDLSNVDFSATNLYNVDFSSVDLRNSNLQMRDLIEVNLRRSNLSNANLYGTVLSKVDFTEAILEGADFSDAELYNVDFSNAILEKAILRDAILSGVILSNTNLSGAILEGADLEGANLYNVDLSEADLREANFTLAKLIDVDLSEADLRGTQFVEATLTKVNLTAAKLIETNLNKARLTSCLVYGISAWNIKMDDAQQSGLIITLTDEPTITVDNLEIAQFIYLLLQYEKLRDVLNSVVERGVLILGRFGGGGLELLQAIAAKLREMKYLPMIFDFYRPDSRDFTETIMTLAGLSRFVIVDLSGPSVPNELRATIPHFKIPFVPIIEKGRKVYSTFPDLLGYPWVLPPVEFTNKEDLLALLTSKVIEPAEEKFKERQALLQQLFNR